MKRDSQTLLLTLDCAGIFIFAVDGAGAAIAGHLDLFGILVLAFITALGGGIIRDVLIGAIPPQSIRDWRYPIAAFIGGAVAFVLYDFVRQVPPSLLITLDAAGLSLFAVAGTKKALDFNIHPFIAILMGGITGVGGGTIRDLLLSQIPIVLRANIYATAALAGSTAMILAIRAKIPVALASLIGAAACFMLRMLSVWQHWNLPKLMPN